MGKNLWKPRSLYLVTLAAILLVTVFGCSQSTEESGGGQTSGEQTAQTTPRAGTTDQETPTETTATGGTTQQPSQEQRQQARQQSRQDERQSQQADQQRQQGQQGQQRQQQNQQQSQRQTITVRVTGTEGLAFTGRVGSAQELRRVEGDVPEEYELPFAGAAVTATLRKQEPSQGTLGVEVIRDGEVVANRNTSSPTGILNVVWTPQRQGGGS